ncbi:hypothetical protein scyTo_0022102 [Scyliorhinus torazame]|uniref:Uncharacterized protein n=1 Tax=Scyliorhinus torazame TaxID=75743 RepID=A0A401Q6G3_SCYTO|nr:hypothetical protein [Scyliorhinus torazame]
MAEPDPDEGIKEGVQAGVDEPEGLGDGAADVQDVQHGTVGRDGAQRLKGVDKKHGVVGQPADHKDNHDGDYHLQGLLPLEHLGVT